MKYYDTYYLGKAGRYANPQNASDVLPIPYGDLRVGNGPVWSCPLIDIGTNQYMIADCIINTANVTLYNSAGTNITAGATFFVTTITVCTFAAPQGDVFARGTGKTVGGTLLTNPIDILEDILTTAGYTDLDPSSAATAKLQCLGLGYLGAGVLMSDRRLDETTNDLLSSFAGYAYTTDDNSLVVGLSTEGDKNQVRAYLDENAFDGSESYDFDIGNIINNAECYFGKAYLQTDRRFKDGVRSEYMDHDDGTTTQDLTSIGKYGQRKRETPFQFNWIYDLTVAQAVQARIVATYKDKIGIFRATENRIDNMPAEIGTYAAFTTRLLYDSEGEPVSNRLGKILGKNTSLSRRAIEFKMTDDGSTL